MVTETVCAFSGVDLSAPSGGGTTYYWSDAQYWSLARDKNMAIIFMEINRIDSGVSVSVVAEDSAGRVYKALTLSGNSLNGQGSVRVLVQNFAANLKIGVSVQHASTNNGANVTLEYALKSY